MTFPVVLFMLEGIERKPRLQSFFLGWCFGFGYFIVALHWIGFAFLVDAEAYLWMMPFAVGGPLAVYWGLALLCVTLSRRKGLPAALVFAVSLAVFEYLRGCLVLPAFPGPHQAWQVMAWGRLPRRPRCGGMPALTLLMCIMGGKRCAVHFFSGPRLHRFAAVLIIATLPLCWAWGSYRLQDGVFVAHVDGVRIRIVQPNISQDSKWRDENARVIFDQLLEMSARAAPDGTQATHIIWPETAVSFLIDESAGAQTELAQVLGGSKTLVTGALRRDINTTGDGEDRQGLQQHTDL